jgi:hypothetical protein
LIPRNLGLESRPFEEEPPCFFEAKRTETSENADCVAREVSGRPARASSDEGGGGADEGQRRGWRETARISRDRGGRRLVGPPIGERAAGRGAPGVADASEEVSAPRPSAWRRLCISRARKSGREIGWRNSKSRRCCPSSAAGRVRFQLRFQQRRRDETRFREKSRGNNEALTRRSASPRREPWLPSRG